MKDATIKFNSETTPPVRKHELREINLDELKPHPLNVTIYGEQEPDPELVESIKVCGILTPLQVRPDNVIVSGHRRCQAAREAGLSKVPVDVINAAADETSQEEEILEANRQRPKNNEQRIREYVAYKRIEAAKAKQRQGKRTDNVMNSSRGDSNKACGKARDLAAEKVGMAGSTAAHGAAVVGVIDQFKKEGAMQQARDLRELLNEKSIESAYRKGQAEGWIPGARPTKSRKPSKKDKTAGNKPANSLGSDPTAPDNGGVQPVADNPPSAPEVVVGPDSDAHAPASTPAPEAVEVAVGGEDAPGAQKALQEEKDDALPEFETTAGKKQHYDMIIANLDSTVSVEKLGRLTLIAETNSCVFVRLNGLPLGKVTDAFPRNHFHLACIVDIILGPVTGNPSVMRQINVVVVLVKGHSKSLQNFDSVALSIEGCDWRRKLFRYAAGVLSEDVPDKPLLLEGDGLREFFTSSQ